MRSIALLIFAFHAKSIRVLSNADNWIPRNSAAPQQFSSAAQRSLPVIKIDHQGNVKSSEVSKQQLANELGVPIRDLRIVDPSFPTQIQAVFLARNKAILFCVENIKVIIRYNEAVVFSPYQKEVMQYVPALQNHISQYNSEAKINGLEADNIPPTRFEHLVLEATLNIACNNLYRKVRSLAPAVATTLNGLRAESKSLGLDSLQQTQVDELLPLKNKLDELIKRVKEIRRAINDVLNNDEDLALMYLPSDVEDYSGTDASTSTSVGHRTGTDTINLEMLFENYLMQVEWIGSDVEEILDEITNTEENVVLQLDLLRNRILRFELLLSIASFVVTFGALFTGLFGMNLLNHLEANKYMFYTVSAAIFGSMASFFVTAVRYGRRERLF